MITIPGFEVRIVKHSDVAQSWPDRLDWDDGDPYTRLDSDCSGNPEWQDYIPDLMIAIVSVDEEGSRLAFLFSASDWYLSEMGAMV